MNKKFLVILHFFIPFSFLYAGWGADTRLTFADGRSWTAFNNGRALAIEDSNTVHVVWCDERDGNFEIYYKRSTDSGASWSSDLRLTNNLNQASMFPSICVSGAYVHVIWERYLNDHFEIFYKRSIDSGVTWSTDTLLTNTNWAIVSAIAAFGSTVHAAWMDYRDGNEEIYYKRSTDSGITWSPDTRLTADTSNSWSPSIDISSSFVHIVWCDYRDDGWEIYYKRSTDSGVTWSADTRLTNSLGASWYPSVAVTGSNVHVAWVDYRDESAEIYYKRSTDSGVTWSVDTRLTNDPSMSTDPSIYALDDLVYVVWSDNRNGNWEVYYKYSSNAGSTWSVDTCLTTKPADSWYSFIAASDSVIHVIWQDYRDGNDEIYHKRNPECSGGIAIEPVKKFTKDFNLSQANPNPVTSMTKIQYYLPLFCKVKLEVFDVTGKQVTILVNERKNPGLYCVNWKIKNFSKKELPNGIYFYRLTAGNYTSTKKMVVVK